MACRRDVQIHETFGGQQVQHNVQFWWTRLLFARSKVCVLKTNKQNIYREKSLVFSIRISGKQLAIWQKILFHVDIRF